MRAPLVSSVVTVVATTTAFAAPAIEASITDFTASATSASYQGQVRAKLEGSYLDSVKRCYLRGKTRAAQAVTRELVFKIERDGKVTLVSASFDKAGRACLANAVKSWKLGVPKDDAGAPVAAIFVIEVSLGTQVELQAAAMANLFAVEGPSSSEGDMSARRPGADLGAQLDEARQGSKPVDVGTGTGSAKAPTPRIMIADKKALDDTNLTADVVTSKLQAAYFSGVKRCYTSRLAQAPSLHGLVALSITIDEVGRAVGSTARGFDKDVDSCLEGQMKNWRFPVPHDGGKPTRAQFTLSVRFAAE